MKTQEIIKKIKKEGIKVPELGIFIIPRQMFNGKTYSEITEEVNEKLIASYEILQNLRNIAFESNWEKYPFMKEFWVFVPNQDKASKSKGYVTGFGANVCGTGLSSSWDQSGQNPSLGVFLYCPIDEKDKAR